MATAEREWGRRLQLVQGLHWLYGEQGDPYAALLRGHPAGTRELYDRCRARGPLWRSRLGTWVCTAHGVAAELTAVPRQPPGGPGQQPRTAVTWDEGLAAAGPPDPFDLGRAHAAAEEGCARLLPGPGGTIDLVAEVAAPLPVRILAELHGLTGADARRLAGALAAAAPALDAALAPPSWPEAAALLTAVGELRALLGDRAARRVVVAARMARELTAAALHALMPRPGTDAPDGRGPDRAARIVTETLRHDPPVKVDAWTAAAEFEVAGVRIGAGEQVAVLVGAAGRDPGVFADPDRFDPDRFDPDRSGSRGRGPEPLMPAPHGVAAGPFARAVAEAAVGAVAGHAPGLRAAGPALRRARRPVTGGLERLPAVAG
ncbi:cytochrome P450 [Streptomyces sp. S186]|uniref:cytochrome P450 n=1 Tax=Streptomyces sp. S186 TaxID=3434395 RepID=UPI003F673398